MKKITEVIMEIPKKQLTNKQACLAYYYANREKCILRMKKYDEDNKEKLLLKKRNIYKAQKDIILLRNKDWRENNRDKYLESKKKEYNKNKEKYATYRKKYEDKKLKEDSYFKFKHSLRTRLRIAIKNQYKTGSAIRDLGCSGEYAYKYIQSLFKEGMSWDNYGKWHIDHIKPLSSFNLEDREQLLKAVNYKNLQPLWALDNLKKNVKIYNY